MRFRIFKSCKVFANSVYSASDKNRYFMGYKMSENKLKIIGWLGTALSVTMYISYIPQIVNNLNGNKTVFIQPLAAAVNCTIWCINAL